MDCCLRTQTASNKKSFRKATNSHVEIELYKGWWFVSANVSRAVSFLRLEWESKWELTFAWVKNIEEITFRVEGVGKEYRFCYRGFSPQTSVLTPSPRLALDP